MTPYRKFFYDQLNKEMKRRNIGFHVILMADTEPNRNWKYEDYKTEYSILLPHKTLTVSNVFIHLNTGLKKIYSKLRPNIVVCAGSYMYPALWRTLSLSKHFGYKTFYWSESHLSEKRNYGSLKIKIREFMRKKVIYRFDGFWYAGKFSREFIEKYASAKAKYIFVPNLIDTNKFGKKVYTHEEKKKIKNKYGIPNDKRVLLTPARLSAVKGLKEFLQLYNQSSSNCHAVYLIAGDGELKEEIESYCTENLLDVRLLGYKSEDEMVELYAISDFFVMPSLSDPNPLTCIEACWCSLPLLVSRHVGNYPEIISEGKNGYVFSYEDKDDAIRKIDWMLQSSDKWMKTAGEFSHRVAYNLYDPASVIVRLINELIS